MKTKGTTGASKSPGPAAARLSVVVPTLGRETVVRTVKTLLAAHGGNLLEIVVAGKIADPAVCGKLREIMALHGNVRHLEVQYETGDLSRKRNAGLAWSHGEFVAFLDDDVEVERDWPGRILEAFGDGRVGLVSGPGLVPEGLNVVGRMAGLALSSRGAGYVSKRYVKGGTGIRDANWDDIIGCNHAFRRVAFGEMGGVPVDCIPGEDILSAYRTHLKGWKIRFAPEARVWHWPRQSLGRFWRQMWRYGAARIRLMRKGVPWRLSTLVPGLWVGVTVALAVAGIWLRLMWALLAMDLVAYALVAFGIVVVTVRETRQWGDLRLWGMLWIMHVAYGLGEWLELLRPARDLSDVPVAAVSKMAGSQKGAAHGT